MTIEQIKESIMYGDYITLGKILGIDTQTARMRFRRNKEDAIAGMHKIIKQREQLLNQFKQSEIFEDEIILVRPTRLLKYKKSGLTPSYSRELTDNLLKLLNEDKIFKENNINLDMLSEKLETTRHNTSQIINEHFKLNFSELMNKYRIIEAVEILKDNELDNLKIIQVAYDVGFNNKASFYKSFKKYLSQTPLRYLQSL